MLTAIGRGFVAMVAERRVAAVLWLYGLMLGVVATLPAARWWTGAMQYSPEYDGLLQRLRIGLLGELTNYDLTSVWALNLWSAIAIAVLALLGNAWMSAGTLGLLAGEAGPVPWLGRFGQAAGEFFGRFLRMQAYAIVAGVAVVAAGAGATAPLSRYLSNHGTAEQQLAFGVGQVVALVALAAYLSMALDYARIRLFLERSHRPLRMTVYGMWFVVRRAWRVLVTAAVMAAALAVLISAYVVARRQMPVGTWQGIWATVALQQLFMYARGAWRAGALASEIAIYRTVHPKWANWGKTSAPPAETRVAPSTTTTLVPRGSATDVDAPEVTPVSSLAAKPDTSSEPFWPLSEAAVAAIFPPVDDRPAPPPAVPAPVADASPPDVDPRAPEPGPAESNPTPEPRGE